MVPMAMPDGADIGYCYDCTLSDGTLIRHDDMCKEQNHKVIVPVSYEADSGPEDTYDEHHRLTN